MWWPIITSACHRCPWISTRRDEGPSAVRGLPVQLKYRPCQRSSRGQTGQRGGGARPGVLRTSTGRAATSEPQVSDPAQHGRLPEGAVSSPGCARTSRYEKPLAGDFVDHALTSPSARTVRPHRPAARPRARRRQPQPTVGYSTDQLGRMVRRPAPQAPRWRARRPVRGPGRRRPDPRRVSRPRCAR